jgi:hypothetical protein
MEQRALNPLLKWQPWPHGDPAPEIYDILREVLDRQQLLQVANVLLQAEIAVSEARLQSARQLQEVIAKGIG